jgi:hypothetical protein
MRLQTACRNLETITGREYPQVSNAAPLQADARTN